MSSSLQPPNISTSPNPGPLYLPDRSRSSLEGSRLRGRFEPRPRGSCMTATVQLLIRRVKTASPARWGMISLRSFPLCSGCLSAFVSRFLCSLYLSNLGPSLWSSSRSKPGVHDLSPSHYFSAALGVGYFLSTRSSIDLSRTSMKMQVNRASR